MTPEQQLDGFLDQYTPQIAELAREVLAAMRRRLPGATELVYDNYNALAIGFGPGERTSDAIFSIAVYPKWVNLFFLKGAGLKDPRKLLKGSGNVVRHIRLGSASDLDQDGILELMDRALKVAEPTIDPKAKRQLIIKSISERQRPRRPK